jgi:hypothetical protein
MKKRGKILRDTASGSGLLMIEGQQYRYPEGVWQSEAPSKPGLAVDVELDGNGEVRGITVVSEVQLAREQAGLATVKARQSRIARMPARISLLQFAAAGFLAIAWFFLPAVSVQLPFPGRLDLTFWQILEFLNAGSASEFLDARGNSGAGLYGVAALIAWTAPFLRRVWKRSLALLGGLQPLAFMVAVAFVFRSSIEAAAGRAITLGSGGYLATFACLYFAFESIRAFLVSNPKNARRPESTQPRAA